MKKTFNNIIILSFVLIFFFACGGSSGTPIEHKNNIDKKHEDNTNTDNDKFKTSLRQNSIYYIDDAKKIMNDKNLRINEKKFKQSSLYKNSMDLNNSKDIEELFNSIFIGKDPQPEWFSTKVTPSIILANAGETYTIDVKKCAYNGKIIGDVNQSLLKIEVAIQKDNEVLKLVNSNQISNYAQWLSDGKIEVKIPNELEKGRVLISLKPNFQQKILNDIAQKWSNIIEIDIWKKRDDVIEIKDNEVIFPDKNSSTGFSKESKFSSSELKKEIDNELKQNNRILLPLVVKDITLKIGDKVTYKYKNIPYCGVVQNIIDKDDQEFVTLSPNFNQLYEVVEANSSEIIDLGLYPKNIVYKNLTNENSKITKNFTNKITRGRFGLISEFFKKHCVEGNSLLAINSSLSLYPTDASIDIKFWPNGDKTECKWESSGKEFILPIGRLTGPVIYSAMKFLGAQLKIKPYGEFSIDTSVGIGLTAGYSLKGETNFKVNFPATMLAMGSRDLNSYMVDENANLGLKGGIKIGLDVISDDGYIGHILSLIGVKLEELNIEATIGPEGGIALNALNAKGVDETGKSSSIGYKLSAELAVEASESVSKLVQDLGIPAWKLKFSKNINFASGSSELTYYFTNIVDKGKKAYILDLSSKSNLLSLFFALYDHKGVLSSKDAKSVWNDHSEDIEYDQKDCNDKIVSPVIGCTGLFCGKVEDKAILCKPNYLEVTGYIADAECKVSNKQMSESFWAEGCPYPSKDALRAHIESLENYKNPLPKCQMPKEPMSSPLPPYLGIHLDKEVPKNAILIDENITKTKEFDYSPYNGPVIYSNWRELHGYCRGLTASFDWVVDYLVGKVKVKYFTRKYILKNK